MKHNSIQPRQRILEVAFRLFHTQGYNSTGINQIIDEAAVAKSSLYQHFKSKEELAIEYLNIRHNYWFDKLKSFTDLEKEPEKKTLCAFDFIYDMNEKENFRGCSFLNMLSEIPAENSNILSVIQNHKKELQNFFKDSMGKENDLLSDHIYLLFESAIIESQLFRNNWFVERAKNIVQTLIK